MAVQPTCPNPRCGKTCERVEQKSLPITNLQRLSDRRSGAAFVCPHCGTILSVVPDPDEREASLLASLLRGLGRG